MRKLVARFWRCLQSLFYKVDTGIVDNGTIFITTSCDFSVYTVMIFDDSLDTSFSIKSFSTFLEASKYANSLGWYYPHTDSSRTTLHGE